MIERYEFEANSFGYCNHNKNYTELCIENYFLRKITQPFQNNL